MNEARILIVDDDPHSLEIVRTYLTSRGYAVATARDGHEALSTLERLRPGVVLLDVMMPDMDGWEVARRIRERPEGADVRIVMLTARSDSGPRDAADDYLHKPIQLDELARRVEKHLGDAEPPA